MASKRKPYVREMNAGWWKGNRAYRFYMLREGTALFAVWVSLLLLYGLWDPPGYFELLRNPVVIVLNIAALLAALVHTKTWFELTPKAVNLSDRQSSALTRGLWAAAAAATVLIVLAALAA